MTTSTLVLPVAGEQDLASWVAVAFVASYSSQEPGRRTPPSCGCGSTGAPNTSSSHWRMSAARTWSRTHAISKPEVSLRPRSR
jgi:hypothetical protein